MPSGILPGCFRSAPDTRVRASGRKRPASTRHRAVAGPRSAGSSPPKARRTRSSRSGGPGPPPLGQSQEAPRLQVGSGKLSTRGQARQDVHAPSGRSEGAPALVHGYRGSQGPPPPLLPDVDAAKVQNDKIPAVGLPDGLQNPESPGLLGKGKTDFRGAPMRGPVFVGQEDAGGAAGYPLQLPREVEAADEVSGAVAFDKGRHQEEGGHAFSAFRPRRAATSPELAEDGFSPQAAKTA